MVRFKRLRGVSLLEVLFAMLVGTIGIVGAIALLPVAIEQANKGRESDSQAFIGEAAVNEFKVRGYYLPDLWVVHDGTSYINFDGKSWRFPLDTSGNFATYNYSSMAWEKPDGSAATHAGTPPGPFAAFCFDPLGTSNYLPANTSYGVFPYGRATFQTFASGQSIPVMVRTGIAQLNSNGRPLVNGSSSFNAVSPQVAEAVCFSHDEQRLLRPKEATLPATLEFTTDNVRRELEADRQFSWFATMSPKTDGFSDEYILSIAIVYRRPLPAAAPDILSERLAKVALADGVTGGDAVLTGLTQEDLSVRIGDWVMLGGTTETTPGTGITTNDAKARYRWYRVVNTEAAAVQNGATWERHITLFGPDWNLPNDTSYAVLMTGVRAVYERTIRVQRTSLWN